MGEATVHRTIAKQLEGLAAPGQMIQVFPNTNVRDHAGPWKAYRASIVEEEGGKALRTVRVWAKGEDLVAEGLPVERAALRRIIEDVGPKLRPVANLVLAIIPGHDFEVAVVDDVMMSPGVPEPGLQGLFSYPRIVDEGGERFLRFEARRDGRYARVQVEIGGAGVVEALDVVRDLP